MNTGLIALIASLGIVALCGGGWLLFNSKFWTRNRQAIAANPAYQMAMEAGLIALLTVIWFAPLFSEARADFVWRLGAAPGIAVLFAGVFLRSETLKMSGWLGAVLGAIIANVWPKLVAGEGLAQALREIALPAALAASVSIVVVSALWKAGQMKRLGQ